MPRPLSALVVAVADRHALAIVGDELADAVEDIVHTPDHVTRFADCGHPVCTAARAWRHARDTLQ